MTLPSWRKIGASNYRQFRRRNGVLDQPLQHGFARLVASEALVDIGVLARVAAQSWVAYDLTGSSLWVGAVAAVRAVPSFISPAFTATIANRFDHRMLTASMRAFIGVLAVIQAVLIGTGTMRPWHQMGPLFTGLAIAFAYSPNLPITLAVLFIMGNASIIWGNAILRLIQSHTPPNSRGRIMSLYIIAMGLIPIGWAVGGAVATLAGNETALIFAATCSITITLAAYIASPTLRRS